MFSDSHVIAEATNNESGCGVFAWGIKSVLIKTWGTFSKNCLEHLAVFFAWVPPEGRNNMFSALGWHWARLLL